MIDYQGNELPLFSAMEQMILYFGRLKTPMEKKNLQDQFREWITYAIGEGYEFGERYFTENSYHLITLLEQALEQEKGYGKYHQTEIGLMISFIRYSYYTVTGNYL